MLIHKYKMDEFVPIYHELQALNHRDRECGLAGRTLQDTDDYDCKRFVVVVVVVVVVLGPALKG